MLFRDIDIFFGGGGLSEQFHITVGIHIKDKLKQSSEKNKLFSYLEITFNSK